MSRKPVRIIFTDEHLSSIDSDESTPPITPIINSRDQSLTTKKPVRIIFSNEHLSSIDSDESTPPITPISSVSQNPPKSEALPKKKKMKKKVEAIPHQQKVVKKSKRITAAERYKLAVGRSTAEFPSIEKESIFLQLNGYKFPRTMKINGELFQQFCAGLTAAAKKNSLTLKNGSVRIVNQKRSGLYVHFDDLNAAARFVGEKIVIAQKKLLFQRNYFNNKKTEYVILAYRMCSILAVDWQKALNELFPGKNWTLFIMYDFTGMRSGCYLLSFDTPPVYMGREIIIPTTANERVRYYSFKSDIAPAPDNLNETCTQCSRCDNHYTLMGICYVPSKVLTSADTDIEKPNSWL